MNNEEFEKAEKFEKKFKVAQVFQLSIREELAQLENSEKGAASIFLHGRISGDINTLLKWVSHLEEMLTTKSNSVSNKQILAIKVKQLASEAKSLSQQIGVVLQRHTQDEERTRLLERRTAQATNRFQSAIELMQKEEEHASYSLNRALDIEEQGNSILSKLAQQNENIRMIQNKASDILATLGISRNILKSIQRREKTDKIIIFGGMGFVLLLIFFLYFFVRG